MDINIAVLMPDDATRASFITSKVMKELGELGNVRYNIGGYEASSMMEMLSDADICVTGWGCPSLNKDVLYKASHLRLVAHTGGSVASIVSPELYKQGVFVISGNELYAESVAEGTLAYLLAGLRRIPHYNSMTQKGEWKDGDSKNKGLLDRKIGLVGFGAIARHLVPLLKPFRVEIVVYAEHLNESDCKAYGMTKADTLEQLFSSCDIVSLHLARTPETYHIINKDLLSLMPDDSLLINTARGSIVDEQALADELITGRIHAVLDVFEEEPLPKNSRLRGLNNVILIPHMAGPTVDRHERITLALIEDMKRMLMGEPLQYAIEESHAIRMTNDSLRF